jgi:4-hydroxybenzoyl-CoA thioesterase
MAFRAHLKVRFGDIDQAGIVYYPRFLDYFHIALEELFANELGFDYPTMVLTRQVGLPTVTLTTDFKRPLRFGDEIEIEVSVKRIGGSSITFGYATYRRGQSDPLVWGHNVTVCVEMGSFRKIPVPEWLREALEDYQRRCA